MKRIALVVGLLLALSFQAQAQVTCPTALPTATSFTGASVTQGQFKAQLTGMIAYLTCLLDTPGTTSAAKTKLGLAAVATSGSYADLSNTPVQMPTGMIFPFAGSCSSPPTGFLCANGQAVSRTTYATLFGVVGTTFGSGDGSTTFNVPDLRGRTAFGVDAMGGASAAGRLGSGSTGGITGTAGLGVSGGEQAHTLTGAEDGPHTHGPGTLSGTFSATNSLSSYQDITDCATCGAGSTATLTVSSTEGPSPPFNSVAHFAGAFNTNSTGLLGTNAPINTTYTPTGTISMTGGATASGGSGNAHNNLPPALVLNYLIKTHCSKPVNDNISNGFPLAKAI